MTITVIATLGCQPGQRTTLLPLLDALRQATLQESGCLQYVPNLDPSAPDCVVMVESWRDQAALDAHTASTHFQYFREQAAPLLASLDIRLLQPL
jgi:quinol monooxygenase YgiN